MRELAIAIGLALGAFVGVALTVIAYAAAVGAFIGVGAGAAYLAFQWLTS